MVTSLSLFGAYRLLEWLLEGVGYSRFREPDRRGDMRHGEGRSGESPASLVRASQPPDEVCPAGRVLDDAAVLDPPAPGPLRPAPGDPVQRRGRRFSAGPSVRPEQRA